MRLRAKILLLLLTAGAVLEGAADDDRPPQRIDLPVPIGHEVKGLRVPLRNNEGKMDLEMQMESANRLDEQNVEMRQVVIQTFDQQTEKPDVKIDLKKSVMNMDTNIIRSDEPILVTRADFRLTGDAMEFNSKTRHGRVIGNVHMIIYSHATLEKDQGDKNKTSTRE